ncbi:hypothetical protein GGR52DRAFT_588250 [Hypoxylon sp. FL1284]|nr:hypothetical protein GGR52DRAFT_588250 [Hypoxylon sp. FL1284]
MESLTAVSPGDVRADTGIWQASAPGRRLSTYRRPAAARSTRAGTTSGRRSAASDHVRGPAGGDPGDDLAHALPGSRVFNALVAVRRAGYVLAFRDEDEPDDPGVWFHPPQGTSSSEPSGAQATSGGLR